MGRKKIWNYIIYNLFNLLKPSWKQLSRRGEQRSHECHSESQFSSRHVIELCMNVVYLTQSNNISSKAIAPFQLTSSPSPSLLLQPAPDPILRRHTRPFSDQPYPNWPNRLSATSTVMATRRVRMGDGGSDSVGVSISIRSTWRSSRVFRGRVWWIPQLRKWVLQKTIPELEKKWIWEKSAFNDPYEGTYLW